MRGSSARRSTSSPRSPEADARSSSGSERAGSRYRSCNVAAHLGPGGCFVIEVGVPGLQRLPPGETIRAFDVSETRWGFDEYDVKTQGLTSHHCEIVDGRVERLSIPFRYVWPSELDLMAQLAGMRLRERWAGWKREPFTSESRQHVSVWEQPKI